ncbi:MAG: ATP-grasp domain-containing protein [Anaerolineae bacterium]|nr:ATP-grasp domain-containing protein [Anaerolineae bacterium]
MYASEAAVCKSAGLNCALISYEALVYEQQPAQAVQYINEQTEPTLGLYRGWMLRPEQYTQLFDVLAAKGITLINTPAAYQHTHYLPESYDIIVSATPRSVWLPLANPAEVDDTVLDDIMARLAPFGDRPVIVKDYVKSQKHYWHQACFIPAASDRDGVARVVRRFLALQGDDLNVGLVFREYVELEPLTTHAQSGMPLNKEFRVFVLDGEPILVTEYWTEGNYQNLVPSLAPLQDLMRSVKSRFFTMDVAQQQNGDWLVIELGDAQVAGLPERADPHAFYEAIKARLT